MESGFLYLLPGTWFQARVIWCACLGVLKGNFLIFLGHFQVFFLTFVSEIFHIVFRHFSQICFQIFRCFFSADFPDFLPHFSHSFHILLILFGNFSDIFHSFFLYFSIFFGYIPHIFPPFFPLFSPDFLDIFLCATIKWDSYDPIRPAANSVTTVSYSRCGAHPLGSQDCSQNFISKNPFIFGHISGSRSRQFIVIILLGVIVVCSWEGLIQYVIKTPIY